MFLRPMLLVVWVVVFATVAKAYKLSNLPLNTTGPNAGNLSEVEKNISNMLTESMLGEMKEMQDLPDLENAKDQAEGSEGDEGMGQLGKSLEFLMLKVAQLETLAELQQKELLVAHARIEKLEEKLGMQPPEATDATVRMARSSTEGVKEAHTTLKRVIQKHARQREKRQYHPQAHQTEQPEPEGETEPDLADEEWEELEGQEEQPENRNPAMLQTSDRLLPFIPGGRRRIDKKISNAVSKLDGTGLVGDALSSAYEKAKQAGDGIKFVANTAISTVEMAVNILIKGFSDWSARCPNNFNMKLKREGRWITFDIGRQRCEVSLMGQKITLFDINLGKKSVSFDIIKMIPEPTRSYLNVVIKLGQGLSNCVNADSSQGLLMCIGSKIIETVPPFNYLTKMGDILTEVIEVFAKVASTVVQKAMEQGPSLVQTAATTKFPAAGEPPLLHHKSTNLMIESHTGHVPPGSYLHRELAAVQTNATQEADPDGAITYAMGGGDVHATKLFTQFSGRETDTSSCLAFAPKTRNGNGVSKSDWQVDKKDDFLKLEPWAVPCDNAWMKDNVNKWQGYSFYFGQKAIEKCVKVTFAMGMQPVVAFVGGLQFEVLPKPLFELATTVCWPNKQPGGVDLSVLRSEIKSAGILLFSRTLRLTKRFGSSTDFSTGNIKGSYETWRNAAGLAKGEGRIPMDSLKRSFLQSKSHLGQESQAGETGEAELAKARDKMEQEGLHWKAETDDLYLASVDYGAELNTSVDKTFEAHGEEAARHMASSRSGSGLEEFKLFVFKSPGLVNFGIEGLMSGNTLELGVEMAFGPYKSPPKRIPLVDIGKQFALILAGLPFVSTRSKLTALEALKDFALKDVGKSRGLAVPPGSIVSLYQPATGRYLKMAPKKMEPSSKLKQWGIPDHWNWERFTVVDAGKGEIALHNAAWNRFVGPGSRSSQKDVDKLPTSWGSQRWTIREEGNGEVSLYNKKHKRCLKMWSTGVGSETACGKWTRFIIKPAEKILVPGTMIALHNRRHNRFVKMQGSKLTRSSPKEVTDLPDHWTSERFTVVDAGSNRIALHNAVHNRFVAKGASSAHRNVDKLPDWGSIKFEVYPAGNGEIVLYNRLHNKMLMMSGSKVEMSRSKKPEDLPDSWTWERFRVVRVRPYLQPGSTVALWCKHRSRYVKMNPGSNPRSFLLARASYANHTQNDTLLQFPTFSIPKFTFPKITDIVKKAAEEAKKTATKVTTTTNTQPKVAKKVVPKDGRIVRSSTRSGDGIPDSWKWERFTVVDAGNGQVAFHNSMHNRFMKMTWDKKMVVSKPKTVDALPGTWTAERFTVVPAGDGQFVFHNSLRNRMIRMTGSEVDASGTKSPQDLPKSWKSERFQIVPAKPYLQPGTIVALHCGKHNRFVQMTSRSSLSPTQKRGRNDLPPSWTDALFTVVDAGNAQVGFYSNKHHRFLRMNGAKMDTGTRLGSWERFTVVPTEDGQFVFHNSAFNRMIRMHSKIDSSGKKSPQDLPTGWTFERFRIVVVSDSNTNTVRATFD
ncbi:unnamed protein product [Symbiodinium sp. CCMP2592]|nr:unnamed protein product [Symbiodinium sp. CCMP2592]